MLRGIDRSYPICRLHGRPVSVRPKFLVRRQPLRLLMDYGEGNWFLVFHTISIYSTVESLHH